MRKGNQLMVYGLTPIEILLGGKVKTYRNQDPEISDPYYLDTWYSDSEFESYLNALGYMPTGNYILKVAVVKPDVSTFNPQFIPDSQYSDQDFETLEFSSIILWLQDF